MKNTAWLTAALAAAAMALPAQAEPFHYTSVADLPPAVGVAKARGRPLPYPDAARPWPRNPQTQRRIAEAELWQLLLMGYIKPDLDNQTNLWDAYVLRDGALTIYIGRSRLALYRVAVGELPFLAGADSRGVLRLKPGPEIAEQFRQLKQRFAMALDRVRESACRWPGEWGGYCYRYVPPQRLVSMVDWGHNTRVLDPDTRSYEKILPDRRYY